MIGEGVAAPHHQHMFNARLDFDVDGAVNEIYEVDAERMPPGPDNPWLNAFRQKATRLETETRRAARDRSGDVAHVAHPNPNVRNGLGQPTSYKLVPTMSTPTLLAHPDSPVGKRATFAQHNLWVTPYAPDERRAAGEYPNQHPGGDGLPRWTGAGSLARRHRPRRLVQLRVTHFVRPEDWPVMPVEYSGFLLSPFGFFDRNPALDVPPRATTAHRDASSSRTTTGRVRRAFTCSRPRCTTPGYDVFVVAPNDDRSGTGASIGLVHADQHLDAQQVELPGCEGIPAYALDGPPGLCVCAARLGAFGDPPDIVVSGINSGCNTGRAILHSGTVGAALTAQSFGCSALAVSVDVGRSVALRHRGAHRGRRAADAARRAAAQRAQSQRARARVRRRASVCAGRGSRRSVRCAPRWGTRATVACSSSCARPA